MPWYSQILLYLYKGVSSLVLLDLRLLQNIISSILGSWIVELGQPLLFKALYQEKLKFKNILPSAKQKYLFFVHIHKLVEVNTY